MEPFFGALGKDQRSFLDKNHVCIFSYMIEFKLMFT